MSLTRIQLRDALLRVLSYDTAVSSGAVVDDVALAVNSALQQMWLLGGVGLDYFVRQSITVAVGAGLGQVALAQNVQRVLGPVKLPDGTGLEQVLTRTEFDEWPRLYRGATSRTVTASTPVVFWVESVRNAASGGDGMTLNLHLSPAWAAGGNLTVEGVIECPRFTAADLNTSDLVPVAHGYCETLLLPLARKAVMRSHYFSRQDTLAAQLEADAASALALLGIGAPAERPNDGLGATAQEQPRGGGARR